MDNERRWFAAPAADKRRAKRRRPISEQQKKQTRRIRSQLALQVPPELLERLKVRAAAEGRTHTSVALRAIRAALDAEPPSAGLHDLERRAVTPATRPSHCTIDLNTRAYLMQAAKSALDEEDVSSASEIISLIQGAQAPSRQEQIELELFDTQAPGAEEGTSVGSWVQIIKEGFFPLVVQSGVHVFTSAEVFAWIERHYYGTFLDADVLLDSEGNEKWRTRASRALAKLRKANYVSASPRGKTYAILNP